LLGFCRADDRRVDRGVFRTHAVATVAIGTLRCSAIRWTASTIAFVGVAEQGVAIAIGVGVRVSGR
jgi:hypothetical protein